MPDRSFDVVVVGAGLVGLATAAALLGRRPGLRVGVLEKDAAPARQQSGHNSGVVHSGVYYRPGSWKARFCAEGRERMLRFCEERGVPHERCGKLIAATREGELGRLAALFGRARANGVPGVELVPAERAREIEPHVAAVRALWVPGTAIVDFGRVAAVLAADVAAAGGEVVTGARVRRAVRGGGGWVLETGAGAAAARVLVNCAGLHADEVAAAAGVRPEVRIVPFRGEYRTLAAGSRHLVRGLVYPVPDPALPFLGVHFTRTVAGSVEAGPNAVLATAREGYRRRDVDLREVAGLLSWPGFWRMAARHWRTGLAEQLRSLSTAAFVRDLRRLVPEVRGADLVPGGAGVRAQAVDRRGGLLDDFRVERSPGAVHVLNAPSPGATSSLVIGGHLAALAGEALAAG